MSLEFSGEYHLPVSVAEAWRGLNDPEVLRASIAGCSQLERVSEHEFLAVMTARVGPIAVNFRGRVQLLDLVPERSYTLQAQAMGGAAGFGNMTARIELAPEGAQATGLKYSASAEVGGKLASVGQRLIQSVAKKQADDFFARWIQVMTQGEQAPLASLATAPEGATREATASGTVARAASGGGGLGALVPAWLVLFGAALGGALGYCLALLK
jgi:carbon monoxide dehydrogenase subunit G